MISNRMEPKQCNNFHNQNYLKSGNVDLFTKELFANQSFSLESTDPFMSVCFFRIPNVKIQLFSNNNLFKEFNESTSIIGVDFGKSSSKVILRALANTKIVVSAIVFPNLCANHRLITTQPFETIHFSSNSEEVDYRITDLQEFCIWAPIPYEHIYKLSLNTEQQFDILKFWTNSGMIRAFSGIHNESLISPKGCEFFTWESDNSGTSQYFNITIEMTKYHDFPPIKKMLRGYQASDVNLIFQNSNDNPYIPINNGDESNKSFLEQTIPFLFVITVSLIIGAVIGIVWSIQLFKTVYDEDSPIDDEKYFVANDHMPMPYSIDVNII